MSFGVAIISKQALKATSCYLSSWYFRQPRASRSSIEKKILVKKHDLELAYIVKATPLNDAGERQFFFHLFRLFLWRLLSPILLRLAHAEISRRNVPGNCELPATIQGKDADSTNESPHPTRQMFTQDKFLNKTSSLFNYSRTYFVAEIMSWEIKDINK